LTWRDLVDYLSNRSLSTCPAPNDYAHLIVDATKGEYAKTLALLDRAELINWPALRRELESERGAVEPDADEGGPL
jgi:hypothetical protein